MSLHSKIGASSFYRWSVCPGSVRLSEGIKSESSVYADEGTRAHEIAANLLISGKKSDLDPEDPISIYVNYVNSFYGVAYKKWIEHKFDLSAIHEGCFGTADAVVFGINNRELHVIDYKHGAGIYVDVKNNAQLKYYALGALNSLKIPCSKVVTTIVQPRCSVGEPIRSCEYDPLEILEFEAELVEFAKKTEEPDAPLVPGEHCRFCPAAAMCPELKSTALDNAKKLFGPINPEGPLYDPLEFAKVLEKIPAIEGWLKAINEFAYSELTNGRKIPGFKLVAKRAMRKWINEKDAENGLTGMFPDVKHLFYELPKFKSVAALEKLLHKKQRDKIDAFVVAVSSGNTIVPTSDSRPEVKIFDASQSFARLDILDE